MSTADLVDIGVNLTSKAFRADLAEVMARAQQAGVVQMVVTGTGVESSWAAHDLARAHPGILYSTAGVHPHQARECHPETLVELRTLCGRQGVVAVGECGLDYNRNFSPPATQRRWFAEQVALATELDKPLFLHEREAHQDFAAIVKEHRAALRGAVVHCFTGTGDELETYLALDLHIGITGWICDERRGQHLAALVARIPTDRLMVETDAPYLLPRDLVPRPSNRRNEPAFLPQVLRRIARARNCQPEALARETTRTARTFFAMAAPPDPRDPGDWDATGRREGGKAGISCHDGRGDAG